MTLRIGPFIFVFVLFFGMTPASMAQTKTRIKSQTKSQNTFISSVDQSLTINTVVIAPIDDNLSGIYSRPIEQHFKEVLSQDPQWTPSDFTNFSSFKTESLYSSPTEVVRLANAAKADAVLKARLSKGPAGINGKVTLFSGRDGLPLVEESIDNLQQYETNEVTLAFERTLRSLRNRLPYRGEILSRRGQEITFNAGKSLNIKGGTDISVIQILKVHRHPKLNFIVATEKEILGKARVYKVDDTLSFARIIMEREAGVVQVGNKILPDEYVQYTEPYITEDGKVLTDFNQNKDKDVAYGEKPNEWLPEHPAQYGKVDVLGGVTQYTQSVAFSSLPSVDGTNNLAPTVEIAGEFWISPSWYVGAELRSAAFSVKNDLQGSSPEKVNMTMNSYDLHGGYTFLLSPDFFGPKLQISGGYARFENIASESTPVTFTKMNYGGLVFGFSGQFPVGDQSPTDIGARFKYYWNPSLAESPSSGSPGDIRINDFGFFFNHHAKPKFSYIGEIRFESYSSKFSSNPTRPQNVNSIGHKVTTMLFGVEYLF